MKRKIAVSKLQSSTQETIKKFGPEGTRERFCRMAEKAARNNVPTVADQYRREAILISQQYGL